MASEVFFFVVANLSIAAEVAAVSVAPSVNGFIHAHCIGVGVDAEGGSYYFGVDSGFIMTPPPQRFSARRLF